MSATSPAGRLFACSVLASLLLAVLATSAFAALPRTYTAQAINSPIPTQAAGFGGSLAAIGDLNGDDSADFVVGQNAGSPGSQGQVFIYSGATGTVLDTIVAPDPGGAGAGALFGSPFSDRLADIGSCPGRTNGQLCMNPIGVKDGVPEILVGARGVDAGGVTDTGRVYVYDGATRALMKRIEMPAADRTPTAISSGGTWFGRVVYSPGEPPCAGDLGVGACPPSSGAAAGDVDGGGQPDIFVGASRYTESPATAMPRSHCAAAAPAATCIGAGRAYLYRGELIAGSDPSVTLETAARTYRNPGAQADDPFVFDVTARRELFGNAIAAVGDVGACTAPVAAGEPCPATGVTTTRDMRPEVIISGVRVDLPMNDPDGSLPDVGVNWLVDGASGAILRSYHHPQPQAGATFGSGLGGLAVGDLGGDTNRPDAYLPAVTQDGTYKGQGRGYVMSGDLNAFTSTVNFALLDDPTPAPSGNFGSGYAAVGNLVEQTGKFRNELLVGAGHLGEPGNAQLVNDIYIVDPLTGDVLQTIADPDQKPGSRFGADLTTLGDLNADGFLDFLASAPAYDGPARPAQGRMYILRSDDSPPPPVAPPPPPPAGPPGAAGPTGPAGTAGPTTTQTGRTLELAASRESLRRGQRLTLRGLLESFAGGSGCVARQAVSIQRRRPGSARFATFATRRTNSGGSFSVNTRPTATYVYRARVPATATCGGAVSNRERVTVRRR